ncbi:hypothetical protein IGI04_042722 [Brassica rapa subsp. trilocularis]|uniref:Uncharacterized protein n=1 Tax=Brassica rapa subsp. trilocularis TaxID=1813537 RepID=A0ABQ7KIL7_BRACM|nr:hypothetical protein IGI04_042722 [Brassica rapa subsp. trilocularis]
MRSLYDAGKEKLPDMIMEQLVDKDEEGETEDTLAEEEAVLAIPTGPITRAMTRRLKEAVGNILKISKKQEDCLGLLDLIVSYLILIDLRISIKIIDQDLIISFHHPLNLICYCFNFEKIEFKSSRVDQEAMGSEEDDETFVRRNRLLQEAITKQVMEAMVKLLEENNYLGKLSDGMRSLYDAGKEKLPDMIMEQLVDKDEEGETEDTLAEEEAVLAIPTGPITRAMTRRLKEAVGNILKISKKQEDCLDILMDSNYLNMEMKHRSSTTMELEEERDGDWSRWAKRALESCGLWSSHGKGKPFMEMATEEGQTRGLKLGNEVVQGDTTKSEIEATLGKSKLVRVVEDRGVIRGLRQGKDECYQLVGRLREVWSELDGVKTHTSNPRCCQERRKQDVIFSFLMEEVCELVKYTCDLWEMNRKPERWKGGTSCKRGRLRKLSKEWLMKRRAWRKDSESEHLSDRMSVILKRIKHVLQQMVIGECSYSVYMGETVGDSADMRGMDTKRADECVTKKEWDELLEEQPLLIMRGGMDLNQGSRSITKRIQVSMIRRRHRK